MRIQLDETRFLHVRIQHTNFCTEKKYDVHKPIPGDDETVREPFEAKGKTMAELTLLFTGAAPTVFIGASFCAPCDNFSKSAGLKCSLARAFKKAGTAISKEDRAVVWNKILGGKYKKAQQGEK